MKSFQQKKEALIALKDKSKKAKITIFSTFARAGEKGLSVAKIRDLRKELRPVNAEYLVEKKTIVDKFLKEEKKEADVFKYDGSLGLVLGYEDEVSVAKSAYTFARKNPELKLFDGIFGGKIIGSDLIVELAKLPSREILLGRVAGMIKYPISGLVNVLQANLRNLVGVLNQIANKSATSK